MESELYQEQILDRYHHPRFRGQVLEPTHVAEGANLSCGDELKITARVEKGRFADLKFESRACAICTASTDLLLEKMLNQPVTDVEKLEGTDMQKLIGLPLSPIRLKCALLPLSALKNLERASGPAAPPAQD